MGRGAEGRRGLIGRSLPGGGGDVPGGGVIDGLRQLPATAETEGAGTRPRPLAATCSTDYVFMRFRPNPTTPANPIPRTAIAEGSGTATLILSRLVPSLADQDPMMIV